MGSRSALATSLRLSEVESAADETSRYVDMCMVFRRRKTGEDLLEVGGRWDRIERKYIGEAAKRHVVLVNESQLSLCAALKAWLVKRIQKGEREILHFAGVRRGGGKTHWFVLALAAVAIALPGAMTWAVSPTNQKRDEIERILRAQIPGVLGWWIWKAQPDFRFTWLTGSSLRLLSGEVPETVKQGGAEAVFINEAQDQSKKVYSLGLPAIRNNDERPAGIMFLAANPPQRIRGEWVNEMVKKIIAKKIDGLYFDVDPSLNESLEQKALDKISKAVQEIDPDAARADMGGDWLPVGDRAYPMWRDGTRAIEGVMYHSLVGEIPELGYKDITAEALDEIGIWRTSGLTYQWAIGGDFQGRPHMAALACRIYERLSDGKRLYNFVDEFIAQGDEHDLHEAITDSGEFTPDSAVMVADASGDWQAGKDRRRSLPSFETLQNLRWTVVPPREKLRENSKHASNPPVEVSVGQMYVVMREARILVHPRCAWLIESFEKCPQSRIGPRLVIPGKGGFSHITDCARYLVYRFEPKPDHVKIDSTDVKIVDISRRRRGW